MHTRVGQTIIWGTIATLATGCTPSPRAQAAQALPARPEVEDLTMTLLRIEQKIERLETRLADHDEAMAKACGPRSH